VKDYPLIKYVIAFIIGIIFQSIINIEIQTLLYLFILGFLISTTLFLIFKKIPRSLLVSLSIYFLIFITGASYFAINNLVKSEYPFEKNRIKDAVVYGSVSKINLLHDTKLTFVVEIDSVKIKQKLYSLSDNFLCSINRPNRKNLAKFYDEIEIGNRVEIKGTVQKARGRRNPGEFDYYEYLLTKEISALIYLRDVNNIKIDNRENAHFKNTIFQTRKRTSEIIDNIYNKKSAALIKGLLLADRSEIDYRAKESFINAGVIHVLAVSGLHVGFIVIIFLFLFNRFNIYIRTLLTIIGLILFLLLTNSPPSVFRATIMAVVMLLSFLSNRGYNPINSLALAALILLQLNPSDLFSPGFQLSFSAVLSILILYPLFKQKIDLLDVKNKIVKYLLLFSAVSFAAQLGTLPFTLIYFHKLSLISLAANLFVIPLIGIIICLAILSVSISLFWIWGGMIYASANMLTSEILFDFVKLIGGLEISHLYITDFSFIDSMIYYFFFSISLYDLWKFERLIPYLIFMILITANLFLVLSLDNKDLLPDGKFSIMMIDIGQGDSFLLKFPDGTTAMIDAGNATSSFDNGERVIMPLLKTLGINKIDYAFISHVDGDHYRGFLSMFPKGIIDRVYKPKIDTTQMKDVKLEKIISDEKINRTYYSREILNFSSIHFYILNDTTLSNYKRFDSNNKSGIFKIVHGENSFLFVGDAEKISERLWISIYKSFLQSDVLKVGHHGSKTSSSDKFLNIVNPDIALISAGAYNNFNHPSPIIIDKLRGREMDIYRTDQEGAILIQSDGERITRIDWKEL